MAARNDYANKGAARGTPRKGQPHSSGTKNGVPGWVWLLAGLSIGLFVAFLVTISEEGERQKMATSTSKKAPQKSGAADPRPRQESSPKRDGVKFDFYHILPEMELVIPEDEIQSGGPTNVEPTQYVIQVGSFKNSADAESRRAELFLLNFEPTIQTITIDGKQSWHRVHIGPFSDRRKLDLAQRQLQDNNIEFITLKKRDKDES